MGVLKPELIMRSIIPVVMAGILGMYGLIVAVILSTSSKLLLYFTIYINKIMNKLNRISTIIN